MPLYEVRSLDVWGNAVDGYEINNSFRQGTVRVPPDSDDLALVHALVREGHLNNAAVGAFETGDLAVEDQGMGEFIEITETDPAFAAVDPDGNERWIDANTRAAAEAQLEEGETLEDRGNMRPVLNLELVEGNWKAKPFLRMQIEGATVELRAEPGKIRKSRTGREELVIDVYVDGDFAQTVDYPDGLETGNELGISKSGKVVDSTQDLFETAQVAMDAFLQAGGEGSKAFLKHSPQVEAFIAELNKNYDDFHTGRITYELHGRRNRAIWDRVRAAGVDDEVAQAVSIRTHVAPRYDARAADDDGRARELQVGDRVKFRPEASHPIANIELEIGEEEGVVTQKDAYDLWIRLDRHHDELDEWDNALHFQLNERHFPQLEPDVARSLSRRGLRVSPCGLNADWSVQAWFLSRQGQANRTDGGYYLLDAEDDQDNFAVVRRFNEEIQIPGLHADEGGWQPNPRYNDNTQGVEVVIEDGPLTVVLDQFIRRRDAGELEGA